MLAVHGPDAIAVAITERLSSLGYSGEHFDAKAQQQYLRARFYDPANGRFNRLDPFAGNMQDPQSLHKYAYVHADPIQGVDPTGLFNAVTVSISIDISVGADAQHNGPVVATGARVTPQMLQHVGQQAVRTAAQAGSAGAMMESLVAVLGVGFLGAVAVARITEQQQQIRQHRQNRNDGGGQGGGGGGEDSGNSNNRCLHTVEYGPLDRNGRATGVASQFGRSNVGGPYRGFSGYPSWWPSIPNSSELQRGHLLASSLGGSGGVEFRNMIPIYRNTNVRSGTRGMRTFEHEARIRAQGGECILAFITPVYFTDGNPVPIGIAIVAAGNRGYFYEQLIFPLPINQQPTAKPLTLATLPRWHLLLASD